MQDINTGEKRSIRNISIDRPQTMNGAAPSAPNPNEGPQVPPPPPPREPGMPPFPRTYGRPDKKWVRLSIWGGAALVCVIVLFVIIGSFFEGATVTVTPRHALVSLENTFTVGMTGGDVVPYDEATVSIEESREVAATGQERVEQAASGRIVVYNDYDADSLKLIKNTRFQTPEGLVYRIRDSIVVPGQKKDSSGTTVPGSIEADVFADSPGEEYNIGLTDFTIPGLKEGNDPRYDKVYARSKTPMEGGFVGTVKTASDSETAAARTALKDTLSAKSEGALLASLPEGFVVIPETLTTSYEDLPNADGTKEGTVAIRMKATVRGIAIDGNVLAEAVAKVRVPEYSGEPVRFLDTRGLSLSAITPVSVTELPETFDVAVSGSGTLVWVVETDKLREDLVGVSRSEAQTVFAKHPAVQKADLMVKPFWRRSLPDDPETIDVVENTKEFTE